MRSGAVGKSGRLRLGFERRDGRTVLADLGSRTPCLAQRALHCDDALPDMAWLFMITTSGCVLQGDRLALEVSLGPGARAHVTTQSATKIHSMDANFAMQTQAFTVAEGAYLEFLPEPLIPHRQARFASDTQITIEPSASMLCSEIVQPGRAHHHPDECFGVTLLSLATAAVRPGGAPLFSEKLVIEPLRNPMRQAGVMNGFDVFGNVILCTPPDCAERVLAQVDADLDSERGVAFGACRLPNDAGLVYKVLGRETAQVKAKVRQFWEVARKEITGASIPPPFFWR
jgi:urease accessory protein